MITPDEARALRLEAFRVYAPDGCRCGETNERVLHLHHPDQRGHYWRKVAGGSHIRELLQLRMDGWPHGHVVALCWACHAEVHGRSVEDVARQRAVMEQVKAGAGSSLGVTVDESSPYTSPPVTPTVPSECAIH